MKSEEFDQQVSKLRPALFRFTKKFVQTPEDSSDLVQETILKALCHRNNFKEDKNLIGWLYTIMRNTFINQYRKDSITRNKIFGDSSLKWIEDESFQKTEDQLHTQEVLAAINSVSQELGRPLKMHLSGYKYEEIAAELNVPMGTVKSRIFLARQEVRNQLPGYY